MDTLAQIYARQKAEGCASDKGDVHSYISIYEDFLAPYRATAKRVLEIGLFRGHSLRMWEQYFIGAEVYGVDCSDQPHGGMADLRPMIAEGAHRIEIFDAENEAEVDRRFPGITFDIVIEDAGHHLDQQLKLRDIFETRITAGGLYVVEDLQSEAAIAAFRARDFEIIDLRAVKNRYDDVLAVFRE